MTEERSANLERNPDILKPRCKGVAEIMEVKIGDLGVDCPVIAHQQGNPPLKPSGMRA